TSGATGGRQKRFVRSRFCACRPVSERESFTRRRRPQHRIKKQEWELSFEDGCLRIGWNASRRLVRSDQTALFIEDLEHHVASSFENPGHLGGEIGKVVPANPIEIHGESHNTLKDRS